MGDHLVFRRRWFLLVNFFTRTALKMRAFALVNRGPADFCVVVVDGFWYSVIPSVGACLKCFFDVFSQVPAKHFRI